MTSKIIKCNCKHSEQDKLYGIGNRIGNETRSGQFRCTVCSSIVGSAQTLVQKVAPAVKEAIKEIAKESSKKPEVKKEAPKGKIDKKSSDKKGSMKGGKR